MAKGGNFERDICKQISLWFSDGEREDIFWRTATSGARATQRRKKGKKTFGQEGDVQAVDPIGQPLISLATIEIKKGYNRASTTCDVLDKGSHMKPQPWERFISQVLKDQSNSKSPYWLLIHKRDRRQTVIYMPWSFYLKLAICPFCSLSKSRPWLKFITSEGLRVFATTLPEFFEHVSSFHIKLIAKPKRRVLRIRKRKK